MYVDIRDLELIKFNNCKECDECCRNKYLAPLFLEDFEKVYKFFPILIAKLDTFKPVMLLSNETSCPYLKNSQCTIYDYRPPACKIYPFSPWYEKVLLDLSCPGIGTEGDILDLDNFQTTNFYEERFSNTTQKLNRSIKWSRNKKLKKVGEIFGIKLYKVVDFGDKHSFYMQKSWIFLKAYKMV